MDLETIITTAKQHLDRGDCVSAYDTAQRALEDDLFDPRLAHIAIIGLARSGANQQALEEFNHYKNRFPKSEQFLAMEGRLHKDQFLVTTDSREAKEWGLKARDLYLEAYKIGSTYYPAINAATLSLLIGDQDTARKLAKEVLALCEKESETGDSGDYYHFATLAEASLLLQEDEKATGFLQQAYDCNRDDHGGMSGTFRQLALICEAHGLSLDTLAPIRPPSVITYTGHMVHGIGKTPGIDPADEPLLKDRIRDYLVRHRVRFAFGSLACGADILVAETVLNHGGEVHIVLPFEADEFKSASVSPGGKNWEQRFDAIMEQATSVTEVVDHAYTGHDLLFEVCAHQAMGMAYLRAQLLGSDAFQVALWNGMEGKNTAGTAGALKRWEDLGLENLVVEVPRPRCEGVTLTPSSREYETTLSRQMKAMIFADVKGYSGLGEKDLPVFVQHWLGSMNTIFEENREHIHYINTWGDAVYLVLDSVNAAAHTALLMSQLFQDQTTRDLGLPSKMGLRVAAHVGPIFETTNPLIGKQDFFGTHVNKTARLEPRTPVSSVYVTEAFAALIALESRGQYRCDYVGNHPLPKNFGRIRMYHLTETNP